MPPIAGSFVITHSFLLVEKGPVNHFHRET
jgi:hypothetical protein